MKKLLFWVALVVCTTTAIAQDTERMDDKGRVALTAVVLDDAIPQGARKQLVNKMSQIAVKGGCAGISNSRFIITCSADVLTKDITATVPALHAYTVNFNFFIGDGVEGRLFSTVSMETKGVGETPDKAYINALKQIKVNDPSFKAFVDKGKQNIIEYYNTQCDFVMAEARAKIARQEYSAAIAQLTAVPTVCEDCYNKALEVSVEAYDAWRESVCKMALNNAQSAWAARDAKTAAEALRDVPQDAPCATDANALKKEIASKLDAKAKQEWDFKMQQYEDQVAANEAKAKAKAEQSNQGVQVQTAQAHSTNAMQIMQEKVKPAEAPAPKYKVKGKWFK